MSFADTLTVFSTRFLGIFIEAAPFLLLGSLVSGLIEVFVQRDDLLRVIPRNPILATLTGGLLGFAFPVCECGVVPVTRRLFHKGLPAPVGITFLLASPVVNPIVIASTYAAFQQRAPAMIALRVLVALGVAVIIGGLFAFQRHPERLFRDAPAVPAHDHDPLPGGLIVAPNPTAPGLLHGLARALTVASDEFFEMGRYLILGSALAAALRVLIAQGDLEALATNPVNSVLVMQALAFLLSICSTADAFVALDFANTFPLGAVLGFLTFGPMVDVKSTLMFLGVFRRRVVLYLILLPLLLTTLIAVWINLNVAW